MKTRKKESSEQGVQLKDYYNKNNLKLSEKRIQELLTKYTVTADIKQKLE